MNILLPLSRHLPIYKPQLTSTFPISHRISEAFLATIIFFFHLLYLKIGLICFTYETVYLFFFYSSKLILISVEITAFALSYHLYNGMRILYNHRILNKVEYSTTTFNIMLFVRVLYGLLYILGRPLQFSGMGTPIHIMGTLPALRFTLLH